MTRVPRPPCWSLPAVRAGETVNCVVEVVGSGNIRSLGEPRLALPNWVRVYKAGENRTVRPGGGGGGSTVIGGTASFSYLLLPRQAGTLRIGPVRYTYFAPRARAYRTTTSRAVELTVAPGSGMAAPVVPMKLASSPPAAMKAVLVNGWAGRSPSMRIPPLIV